MTDEPAATGESSLQRGLESVWERMAPLSIGAVASSAAIIAVSGVMRRALGPRARVLGWVGTIVVIPLGAWLLTRRGERMMTDVGDAADLPRQTEERQLEKPES